jgi:hypothetical protein
MMIALFVLLGALAPLVGGYSTGAGSCAEISSSPGAPVGGKHLSRIEITSGILEAYDITLTVGDSGPLKTGVPAEFEYGKPHFLTLSCSSNAPYLGFLVRLASPVGIDTTAALTPFSDDKDTQVATDTCINIEGVGGLTHTNNDPKCKSQSILEMDEVAQGLILDVTVVVANKGFNSVYYSSQYILNAVTPKITVPTTPDVVYPKPPAPAKKADGAPVASLDLAPITAPAALPVASPDAAPVSLPFSATAPAVAPATAPTTVAGAQDSSPTDASSNASSRHETTGFTACATLSLLVFTSFCFAL